MNVLGIRRKKEYLLQDLGNERIHKLEDVIYWCRYMEQYRPANKKMPTGGTGTTAGRAAKVTLDYKAPVAAVIMVLMVAIWWFDYPGSPDGG